MTKGVKRIIAIVCIIAVLVGIITCVGAALSVNDSLFKNNTPTFMKLDAGGQARKIAGVVTSKDDYESYIIEIPENGALTICLEHEKVTDSGKSGWVVTLYKLLPAEGGNEYKEIAYFESFWADTTSDWDDIGVSAGTYCIMVTPGLYFLPSEYTLSTIFTTTDNYEKEPNDTPQTASPIAVGYGKKGNTSNRREGTDVDWYYFDIDIDSCVNISFTHPDGTFPVVGWTVTLINEKGEKVTQFTSRLTDLIIKTGKLGLRAGRYHISVEAQTDTADEYTLLVGSEKALNFEFEMNDTPETAVGLPQGIKVSGSLADRLLSLDKDYYKFTLDGDGYIDLTFTHELLEGDKNGWNIRLLKQLDDGSYYEIVRRISKWNVQTTELKSYGLPAGEYYLLIDGDSVSYNSETYSVMWSFTEIADYEKEPNSTKLNCQTIDFGKKYTGAIISSDVTYDEDYYRFNLVTETTVCLEFYHRSLAGSDVCWNISIIDDKGNVVREMTSALNEPLNSTGTFQLPAGVYFIKVETGMYGSEVPYQIKLIG